MASKLLFASPPGSTQLVSGRNKITSLAVSDSIAFNALQGRTAWYPLPGLNLLIEASTSGPGGVDLFVYGEQ